MHGPGRIDSKRRRAEEARFSRVKNFDIVSFIRDLNIYLGQTLLSTGVERRIDPFVRGDIERSIALVGAEDIDVSPDGTFAVISAFDRHGLRNGMNVQGGLYRLDLTDASAAPILLTGDFTGVLRPHGISLWENSDGSYTIHAVNHAGSGHSIEIFTLEEGTVTHEATLRDPALVNPNDIIPLDGERFYVTNDHGSPAEPAITVETFLGFPLSNVLFFDGASFRVVADGVAFANGVAYDAARGLLYIASPREFAVRVYGVQSDNSLELEDLIDLGTGADNIDLDDDGALWIGAHPKTLDYALWRAGLAPIAPSEVVRVVYHGPSDHSVDTVLLDDGSLMSASSVAARVGDRLLIGNVSDDHFLFMRLDEEVTNRFF